MLIAGLLWMAVLALAVVAWRRRRGAVAEAAAAALATARPLMLRLPLALLTAAFLIRLVPSAVIGEAIGANSGLTGIMVASVLGGLLPGGPMVSFPLAAVLIEAGAGWPQMVALISAWSVFAVHRILAFELPLMGAGFCALRLGANLCTPVAAGLLAMAGLDLAARLGAAGAG
jgi:hypothetical protein